MSLRGSVEWPRRPRLPAGTAAPAAAWDARSKRFRFPSSRVLMPRYRRLVAVLDRSPNIVGHGVHPDYDWRSAVGADITCCICGRGCGGVSITPKWSCPTARRRTRCARWHWGARTGCTWEAHRPANQKRAAHHPCAAACFFITLSTIPNSFSTVNGFSSTVSLCKASS
jgi:hypothetical protein